MSLTTFNKHHLTKTCLLLSETFQHLNHPVTSSCTSTSGSLQNLLLLFALNQSPSNFIWCHKFLPSRLHQNLARQQLFFLRDSEGMFLSGFFQFRQRNKEEVLSELQVGSSKAANQGSAWSHGFGVHRKCRGFLRSVYRHSPDPPLKSVVKAVEEQCAGLRQLGRF